MKNLVIIALPKATHNKTEVSYVFQAFVHCSAYFIFQLTKDFSIPIMYSVAHQSVKVICIKLKILAWF